MKHVKSFLLFLLLLGFSVTVLKAQAINTVTGGNSTGSGGSVSYTVGQSFYNTVNGTNGTLDHGVQIPFEISVVTEIVEARNITLECTIYPNPTTGLLKLTVESFDFENLRFRLYDINGSLLQEEKIESEETKISIENLSNSVYFLIVSKNNLQVKVFKIVKQ
jgi:hypothetical protein